MKSPFVSELQPNQVITSVFLVQSKDIRQKKSGEPYLSLMLGDRTGDVEAKMWDNAADVMHTFERDDFVRLKGLYQIFQNRPQITVHKLIRMDEREIDFADFFPASKRRPEEMWAELQEIIAGLTNPHLKALLDVIFADPRIARAYVMAPAAKMIHHAYLGGLIEHVLSLCKLARFTSAHYAGIDADLLITGCILHDLGKIDELTYDRGFGYSAEGQLIGHIVMGVRIIEEKLREIPDFPPRLRSLLEHMILSHHGELEYGSPKVPVFPEAMLLHHLDNLDSKVECMRSLVEKDRQYEGCWTTYSSSLDRAVLKKLKFLEEPPKAASHAPAEPTRANGLPPVTDRRPAPPPAQAEAAPSDAPRISTPSPQPNPVLTRPEPGPQAEVEASATTQPGPAPVEPRATDPSPAPPLSANELPVVAHPAPGRPGNVQPVVAPPRTPPPPPPPVRPDRPGSVFGDKLRQALQTDAPKG